MEPFRGSLYHLTDYDTLSKKMTRERDLKKTCLYMGRDLRLKSRFAKSWQQKGSFLGDIVDIVDASVRMECWSRWNVVRSSPLAAHQTVAKQGLRRHSDATVYLRDSSSSGKVRSGNRSLRPSLRCNSDPFQNYI